MKFQLSNPKLSQERWFLFFVYYTDLFTGRSIKKQLKASLGEQFKKRHDNHKKIIFQSHVSDLDQKKYSKFSYCYTGLGTGCSTKEAITASFVEHSKENQENTICVYRRSSSEAAQGVQTPALFFYIPNCALKFLDQFRRNALKNQFKK